MIKVVALFFMVMVMISAGTVYSLKDTTERLEARKQQLAAKILKDRAAIRVLNAEMAYLSRPERLEVLSARFLALGPSTSDQMADNTTSIAGRENFEQVSFPIDNFPVLLPQEKPSFKKSSRNVNIASHAPVSDPVFEQANNSAPKVAHDYEASSSLAVKVSQKKKSHNTAQNTTQNISFYERISYKLENDE